MGLIHVETGTGNFLVIVAAGWRATTARSVAPSIPKVRIASEGR